LAPGVGDSPAYLALDYSPFRYDSGDGKGKKKDSVSSTPNDLELETDCDQYIDMNSMLSLAAGDAFISNPDALFNHDKNAYFSDFLDGRRVYHAHDLDAAIRDVEMNIYAQVSSKGRKTSVSQAAYQETILNHPVYRRQYSAIMRNALATTLHPDHQGGMLDFLDEAEVLLTDALVVDPNSKFGSAGEVAGKFRNLRAWVVDRWSNVMDQVGINEPPPRD
jgi:hypothetical protein